MKAAHGSSVVHFEGISQVFHAARPPPGELAARIPDAPEAMGDWNIGPNPDHVGENGGLVEFSMPLARNKERYRDQGVDRVLPDAVIIQGFQCPGRQWMP